MICYFCKENKTNMTIKFPEVPFQPVDKEPYPCCKPCYDRLNDNPRGKDPRKKKYFGKKTYRVYCSCIYKEQVEMEV